MSEKIERIRHKLTEAIPDPAPEAGRPDDQGTGQEPRAADLKKHNAGIQPGMKERMVDIGRAENIKGRGAPDN